MAKFKIEFDTDNAAFQPNARMEITAILREVIAWVDRGENFNGRKVLDSNGNSIGTVEWIGDDDGLGRVSELIG